MYGKTHCAKQRNKGLNTTWQPSSSLIDVIGIYSPFIHGGTIRPHDLQLVLVISKKGKV